MQITFSPMRCDERLILERQGETLLINGTSFDFSALPEGDTYVPTGPNSEWFVAPVSRSGGVLGLHLILPHGSRAAQDTLFPTLLVAQQDGVLPVPDWEIPEIPDS